MNFVAGVSRFFVGETMPIETTTIPVIWQSTACCVVAKPAGLPTQAPPAYPSLESHLRRQFSGYLALPHRLDRPVSGCLLAATTKRAARLLSQQFESRKVAKHYLAWVSGQLPGDQHRWHDRICKIAGQAKAQLVSDTTSESDASGETQPKEAITQVRVLRRESIGTLLLLQPLTGRMHQLRLQCSARGCPILGDRLYGSETDFMAAGDGSTKLKNGAGVACESIAVLEPPIALHAWQLQFCDPLNGAATTVQWLPLWYGAYTVSAETCAPSGSS